MELDLNGERMQTGNTKTMIFNVDHIVSYVSRYMSLQPGDIITTGTPPGVGMARKPQIFLKDGDVMDLKTSYDKVVLVRSLIPTREIGFLPGDEEDKAALYQVPYQNMVQFMFEMQNEQQFNNLYDKLKGQGTLYFLSTSFLRGLTFDNTIIIVDECQNLNFHELDTIITRVGQDSKIVFCGDFDQTDLVKQNERNGLHDFLRILEEMDEFNCTEFTIGDIVRSGFVRSYLINKIKLGIGIE